MINLTVSTSGSRRGRMVEKCESLDYSRSYWNAERNEPDVSQSVEIQLTPEAALGVAIDLLMKLVDEGVLVGWTTTLPQRG